MHILDELEARGLVADITNRDELATLLSSGVVPFYAGYDPTAPSLHVGHLIPITLQARLQRAGHKPLLVVGGATGMIGDPSGKSDERNLLDSETLQENVARARGQLERLLDFAPGPSAAVMLDNYAWFAGMGYLEFLRDIGKLVSINYMIAKESVRARLEDREHGISYTEFSYMLLQAYDFVHLARTHGCRLQLGGSDQWGNITAGCELQRKLGGLPVFGLVAPLLLDSSGQKMGKTSSGNRVWLDPEQTSPYAFYQYWLNIDDQEVGKLLKHFLWRPLDEVDELIRAHAEAPHQRQGQRALAEDLTRWVHGEEGLRRAIAASQVMFGGTLEGLSDADLAPILADVPSSEIARGELDQGVSLLDLIAQVQLAKSKGAARRLVQSGGVYINNLRATDPNEVLTREHLGTESMIVLRAGKKSYHIVRIR